MNRVPALAVAAAVALVACGDVGGDGPRAGDVPAATTGTAASDLESVETDVDAAVVDLSRFTPAGSDAGVPPDLDPRPGGAPGYTRYVFRHNGEAVVPTLVEGPQGRQVRCQDEALPCSHGDLRELLDSGGEVPDALAMDRTTLAELVAQLDQLRAFASRHATPDDACAAGFVSDRIQTPNMGSHFYRIENITDGVFDPSQPEILLYARSDGELPEGPVGRCRAGTWDGPAMDLVGTAFLLPAQLHGDDHPDGFAGELDNWHVHYNLCRGSSSGRDTFTTEQECVAQGGDWAPAIGWMLHAWVEPDHDNQLGVFSMWNPTIAPGGEADGILDARRVLAPDDEVVPSLIANFGFERVISVPAGDPLRFSNNDAVPHTVTAGTPDDPAPATFDVGLLLPGEQADVVLTVPGTYALFCTLHPDMAATVDVTPAS